jgi:hypothetical protein
MSTRVVLIASGIIAVLVGLNYLLFAESGVASFQIGEATLAARLFARATGAAVLAIGVINILSVGDTGSQALRAVIVGNIVVHAASLYGDYVAEGFDRNAILYVTTAIHVVFVAAFAWLLLAQARGRAA